jgi:hypothetical protein
VESLNRKGVYSREKKRRFTMLKLDLSRKQLGWRLIVVAALVVALMSGAIVPQLDTASAQTSPSRNLPGPDPTTVERGVTLDVIVTFTAPSDAFNSIGLVDQVPTGWTIQVDKTWCNPVADAVNIVGNQSEFVWFGPYGSGQAFTALYKVTIPGDAECVTYPFDGQLGYKIAGSATSFEPIGGDGTVIVDAPHLGTTPDPPSHDFGTVVTGTILNWSFDITNSGIGELSWNITADTEISVSSSSGTTTTETDTIDVQIDTAGLIACPQNPYSGTITINSNGGCNGAESKVGSINVTVTMEAVRELPDFALIDGDPFMVTINFTAPNDNFNTIGLVDDVPTGWVIQVDPNWCTPVADQATKVGDQAQFNWDGSYSAGTTFSAVYEVSVPDGTDEDVYTFANGQLCYSGGACCVPVTGENQITAILCAPVSGLTREVNCNILDGVEISLDGVGSVFSDGTGNYTIRASGPGTYTVNASKDGFRTETQTVEVDCVNPVTLNFQAGYGLIPCSPDIWYALDCINLWKYPPGTECDLSMSNALAVINAWLYPGCP